MVIMMDKSLRKILGIFVFVLIVSTMAKLLGVSLRPLVDGYLRVVTYVLTWIAPEILSSVYPAGVRTLVLLVPLVLIGNLVLGIIWLVRSRREGLEME